MNRSLRNLSLTLLLALALLASGCCIAARHHHGPGQQPCQPCAQKCQTPCPDCPCKNAAPPVEASPTAPTPDK